MPNLKRGPKLLLRKKLKEQLFALARAGVPLKIAVEGAGISRAVLYQWLKRAESGEEPYASFAIELRTAQATARSQMVQQIRKHGAKYWQASAWLLEHTDPENFAFKTQLKLRIEAECEKLLSIAGELCCGDCYARLLQRLSGNSIVTLGEAASLGEIGGGTEKGSDCAARD